MIAATYRNGSTRTPTKSPSEALRALIACDRIAGLDSAAAGEVLGHAFAEQGAQVAVYPMATGGEALAAALRRLDAHAHVSAPSDLQDLLGALGAGAGGAHYLDLTELGELDVDEVLDAADPESLAGLRSAARSLVAVVADGDASVPLTGMPGVIAERGRRDGVDLAVTLAADARASAWLERAGIDGGPGSGSASGLGALVQAAGGLILDGVGACAHAGGLAQVMTRADVVVTGGEQLDFLAVGGPVVREVAGLAGSALVPVIAVVGRSFVSARELRLAGIETAYPILSGAGESHPTEDQFRATAAKVAATWRW